MPSLAFTLLLKRFNIFLPYDIAEPCLARFYAFSIFFYYAGVMPSLALLVFMPFQCVA